MGSSADALKVFKTILHTIPLLVVETRREVDEVKELLGIAKEYALALRIELKRKDTADPPPCTPGAPSPSAPRSLSCRSGGSLLCGVVALGARSAGAAECMEPTLSAFFAGQHLSLCCFRVSLPCMFVVVWVWLFLVGECLVFIVLGLNGA